MKSFVVNFRYSGLLSDVDQFSRLFDGNDPNFLVELSKLVHFLSVKLKSACELEDMVNVIDKPEEATMFVMELAGLLRELCKDDKKMFSPESKVMLFDHTRLSL